MRMLVVEDDNVLADGLTQALRQSGHVVDCMANGKDADLTLMTHEYDLVVLDIGVPGMDGFEVLERLRQRKNRVPVLILTARDALRDRVQGLDLGADDYLTKPFDMPELEARVRALVRRAEGAASADIAVGDLVLDSAGRRVLYQGQVLEFSAREIAMLEILMVRAGRVVSKEHLLERLYDWDQDVGANAIEVYIHRIRKKLQSAQVSIRTIRGLGYLLERPQE